MQKLHFRGQDRVAEFNYLKTPREEYLNKVKAAVEAEGVTARTVIIPGKPTDEICKYAARSDVDIVLVSPSGVGGIVGWAWDLLQIRWQGIALSLSCP
ncbi:hypothetical protein PITCH_A1160004 [uncultured Desulfobacterium sp.]|uniref:UspA domain-containing protein n=1 Tax=uncultured Desulfobacterium sp. TaxID=201089 RepID=A0A445MRK9_9BACT|nr:hypothetical protein PITCH_A1160004 [uncultured Desulfobacterium sp.]